MGSTSSSVNDSKEATRPDLEIQYKTLARVMRVFNERREYWTRMISEAHPDRNHEAQLGQHEAYMVQRLVAEAFGMDDSQGSKMGREYGDAPLLVPKSHSDGTE